jgi:hypothetical protein
MKKIITAFVLTIVSIAAYAACTTHTYTDSRGRFVVCTTCCDSRGNCNTWCN